MAKIIKGKNPKKPYTVRYWYEGHQRERSFKTWREANEFLVKFEHDRREHTFVDPRLAAEKFGHAAERWVSRLTGAESSKQAYRRVLRNHLNPEIGDRPISQVARDRAAMQDLLLVRLPGRGLSRASVQLGYAVIGAVINDAVKGGRLASSRIGGLTLPAQDQRAEFVFATYKQLDTMSTKLTDHGDMVWLMRGCGLRAGEALAVEYEDYMHGVLRVARQQRQDGSSGPLKHRKPGEYRDVPVPSYVIQKLAGRETRGAPRSGPIFPKVSRSTFDRRFRRARDAAGLPKDFTPHTLRHIFASVALAGSVPITDVSQWLGHRDINVTYAIYGHLVPSSWESARRALDDEYERLRGRVAIPDDFIARFDDPDLDG